MRDSFNNSGHSCYYKYLKTEKKYNNLHRRIEEKINDGSFWELAGQIRNELLRRLKILFRRLLQTKGTTWNKYGG
ncbi:MAG: hypothetical protein PVH88_19900 [Ignavibacteria bacterium]|jgi:hypothetical protein